MFRGLCIWLVTVAIVFLWIPRSANGQQQSEKQTILLQTTLEQYCISCHSNQTPTANLSLEKLDPLQVGEQFNIWEKVIEKLRAGAMPPVGHPRPAKRTYDKLATWLESEIDRFTVINPNPGRTNTFHRLNRSEYANAVRDLLTLEVDVDSLLPADNIDRNGFDNMADALTVSPALMERYLSAARKIARLAVGETPHAPVSQNYYVPILLRQNNRMSEDLPFGSRGGVAAQHFFPVAGEYDLEIRMHRNYVNYVRGLGTRHELEIRVDGILIKTFSIGGEEPEGVQAPASYAGNQFGDPAWEKYMLFADSNLRFRFQTKAGPHLVGVSFVRKFTEPEGVLQPRQSVFSSAVNEMRDGYAAVERVVITGPYASHGPGDTPSRRRLFACRPASEKQPDEELCALQILSSLAQRAYRRPVETADLETLMNFYRVGRSAADFDAGIQLALERLLVSPDFLFRIERDPANIEAGAVYPLSSLELASRLSFFLWSSIPDAELLEIAERDALQDPDVLAQQTRRMLTDPRAKALVHNFAGQWFYLRNLRTVRPDGITFPEWDENLREAFRKETELFFEDMVREDRSVLDLLDADHTFANERLAAHYGIPGVHGSHFRRVQLSSKLTEQRGGILGHGSLLTVTSYPNRTSPVLRGKWLLTNILGTPPPPPPADVPDLPDRGDEGQTATVRDRLARHREAPACSACHAPMDPLGFALENYDAVGRWRTTSETGLPFDTSGLLPDGTRFDGPRGLRTLLLGRHSQFISTVTGKLLTYALGRNLKPFDQSSVRKIATSTTNQNYSWSSIIVGVVQSTPFRMRRSKL
ncbi:MAG: hypothetical protein CMN58_08365 [Solibacterales bacterium]|nr:hypothetical protein [Bryobacterales bacterium]